LLLELEHSPLELLEETSTTFLCSQEDINDRWREKKSCWNKRTQTQKEIKEKVVGGGTVPPGPAID
jgi:hypothetical protein